VAAAIFVHSLFDNLEEMNPLRRALVCREAAGHDATIASRSSGAKAGLNLSAFEP